MQPSRWSALVLVGLAACAAGPMGPAGGETFIDDDGTVKPMGPGSPVPSDIGLPNDLVRIRCNVSTEGIVFGCTQLSGPPVAEERLVAVLKRTRVEPVMQDGKPIEASRTFVFRVRFVMR